MDKNNMKGNSYSDLFEDFFRTDAVQDDVIGSSGAINDDLFKDFLGSTTATGTNDVMTMMPQGNADQFQSFFEQPQAQMSFYQQAQMPAYSYQPPASAAIQKPGFIRNRTRKNMRQKSVAAAVKASHMMAAVSGQPGSGYPLMQMYQAAAFPPVVAAANQIPFYQAAAQIPAYQPPQPQPQMILAKSPVPQPAAPQLLRSSNNPSHLNSPARSPNSNSSDYVKFKLQQKIRSRMVSKGQIPPNPTEEELRLCGIQTPSSLSAPQNHVSQLPTPKQSPQIPRNNTAAFIAAPVMINNQSQAHQQQNDDFMKYLDLSGYSQKDPLMMSDTNMTMQNINIKQQQQMPIQQSDFTFPQQDLMQNNNGTINYDQFFSDFILY